MSRSSSTLALRRSPAALAMSATLPILLATGLAHEALAVPSNSATANAYGSQQTQTAATTVSVGATAQGGGGSAAANAAAGPGVLSCSCAMSACALADPPDGQVCNDANGNSSFNDQVTIVSDAPDGTPVDVLATFNVQGNLDGTGYYLYQSGCLVFTTGLAGASGSSGGVVVTSSNAPISSTSSGSISFYAGYTFSISASSNVDVGNRCCDPGYASRGMTMALTASLTLTVPALPAGATYVHLIGSDGHDYGIATTSVAGLASGREGLSSARPNPTRGVSRIDLTLARPRSVDVGVFDLAGRRVATLAHGLLAPGTHALTWDGRDDRGTIAGGGMYFVHARGDGLEVTSRVLRVR
jgi:hypothetical protein